MACRSCGSTTNKPKENIIQANSLEYTETKAQALEDVVKHFESLPNMRTGSRQDIDRMFKNYNILFDKQLVNNLDARAIDLVFRQLKFGVYDKYKAGQFHLETPDTKPAISLDITDDNSEKTANSNILSNTSSSAGEPTKTRQGREKQVINPESKTTRKQRKQ